VAAVAGNAHAEGQCWDGRGACLLRRSLLKRMVDEAATSRSGNKFGETATRDQPPPGSRSTLISSSPQEASQSPVSMAIDCEDDPALSE
jgi:hypothetical protein